MELRRILAPFDFSEAAQHAARYAGELAVHFDAEVTLLHVLPPLHYDFAMTEPSAEQLKEVNDRRKANAWQALTTVMPSLLEARHAECQVIEGDAADEIIAAANNDGFDAVVMSTRGASAFRRLFMIGSVTSKVLHGALRPVITSVHFEHRESPLAIRRVMCAIDLGPQSQNVLCWGSRAAGAFGAELEVAHAAPKLDSVASGGEGNDLRRTACKRLVERVEILQKTMGMEVRTRIAFDDPACAVSGLAREQRADLLVLGRGVAHDLVGRLRATAYDIIRQSPCPVASI